MQCTHKVKIRARRLLCLVSFFVLISWCENPPSGERVEELRNGYWRPRQFHLSPAIFPFLSPPSLPFSLPRYFLPALVFNFFSSSLTRYIPTPVVSLVTFSRPFVCHCNSSISSNETKVSFRSNNSSRERMKNEKKVVKK